MTGTTWTGLVRDGRRRVRVRLRRIAGLAGEIELRPDPREPAVMLVRAGLSAGDLDRGHRLAERAWRCRPRRAT